MASFEEVGHSQLVTQLANYMEENKLTQRSVVEALKLSSQSALSAWLGKTPSASGRLGTEQEKQIDRRVAACLYGEGDFFATAAAACFAGARDRVDDGVAQSTEPRPKRQAVERHGKYSYLHRHGNYSSQMQDGNAAYFCKFPGCGKGYASRDAVRRHCRQNHLEWMDGLQEEGGWLGTTEEEKEEGSSKRKVTKTWKPLAPQQSQATDTEPLPAGSYAVAFLVDERYMGAGQRRKRQFRVRWLGYTPEDDTWENASSILTPVLIDNFERIRDGGGLTKCALQQVRRRLWRMRDSHAAGEAHALRVGCLLNPPSPMPFAGAQAWPSRSPPRAASGRGGRYMAGGAQRGVRRGARRQRGGAAWVEWLG
jgi:hypothetical protein